MAPTALHLLTFAVVAVAVAVASGVYYGSHLEEAPVTSRWHVVAMSPEFMRDASSKAYSALMQKFTVSLIKSVSVDPGSACAGWWGTTCRAVETVRPSVRPPVPPSVECSPQTWSGQVRPQFA